MANIVWHTKLRISLDLAKDDLGHPEYDGRWEMVYSMDRLYASRSVPVAEPDLQCGGVCRDAGVEAPMHLRLRANGRREAVHERREDEERHIVPVSDEHKAHQERILRVAEEGGFHGDSEVRTRWAAAGSRPTRSSKKPTDDASAGKSTCLPLAPRDPAASARGEG